MVHLQGHRVAPGFQVLLPQKGGQAREHLEEESQSVSAPFASARWEKSRADPRKRQRDLSEGPQRAHIAHREQASFSLIRWALDCDRGETETQPLTQRRAEVEPLLACADMTSMKALEVSENFLVSTGLGTLQGEDRESQNPRRASESSWYGPNRGLKEEAGQREAVPAQSLSQ